MAAAEETAKDDIKIHVNQLPLPSQLAVSRLSVDGEDLIEEQRVEFPLFRPTSQRSENSWIISLFVIIHLVVFAATMIVNDCWHNSHGDCAIKPLGRLSFQPLAENPLLGPSASALDNVGAIRQTLFTDHHQFWRVLTSPWLHAGLVHIIINLCSVVFVGIHLEQEFGSLRIGVTYILSGVTATLLAALFVTDNSSVTSSSALFGLLGMMLSGLIRYWKHYTKKLAAILLFLIILMINLILGLVPYINNISNVGGFISGFLIGFVLLFEPQLDRIAQKKGGLFEYDLKHKVQKKQKWDRPVLRGVSLAILVFIFAGVSIAVLRGTNVSKYCSWCQCIDCIPSKWWICADKAKHCEAMIYSDQLTLTCTDNGNYRVLPYTDISPGRMEDLCSLICS
nr:RHOMBOID-like protein 8 [Ipomoea batatas]